MATEQRRFQVFVSSTYEDLREPRQQVTMVLLECDAFPTGMEIFPADDDDAWTLIRRVIDASDYYLLVIAGRYGSVDPATGLSYTEMEYDYAVSVGKPVMAFLHGAPAEIPSGLCENSDERREKLENFREKVKKAKHVKFWKSPEELAGQVSRTYNRYVRQYPATGWVRADQLTSAESLKELVEAKSRIEQLETELNEARTSAPSGTEELAQGADEFDVRYNMRIEYRRPDGRSEYVNVWKSVKTTWDSLFAAIGPELLQEATEETLRESIENFLRLGFARENLDGAVKVVNSESAQFQITEDDLKDLVVDLSDEEFGTIRVQLMALGLIRRSDRKRSVTDTRTYWVLTPYGETRTIQLRAIKRTQAPQADSSGAIDEIHVDIS